MSHYQTAKPKQCTQDIDDYKTPQVHTRASTHEMCNGGRIASNRCGFSTELVNLTCALIEIKLTNSNLYSASFLGGWSDRASAVRE